MYYMYVCMYCMYVCMKTHKILTNSVSVVGVKAAAVPSSSAPGNATHHRIAQLARAAATAAAHFHVNVCMYVCMCCILINVCGV